MKNLVLNEVLIPSLYTLYEVDYENIRFNVSERNICARLAHHMECIMRQYDNLSQNGVFRDYFADVEYNRMGNGDLKHYENSHHRPQRMVSDLLIQTRGYAPNLLAVEMKKRGNLRHAEDDRDRLKSLVSSLQNNDVVDRCVHNTLLGAFIEYSVDGVIVELFEKIDGKGEQTEVLQFNYISNSLGKGKLTPSGTATADY